MGGIKWTDEDLRDAVARARSWRGVLRLLGLSSSSGGSAQVVRRNSERLGLDTSHFTGSRRRSDSELANAIETSDSWGEVANELGLVPDRRTEIKLKGHALRLGLDVEHLSIRISDPPGARLPDARLAMSELRSAAPSLVAGWMALRGIPVAVPTQPQVYDLLITTDDGIQRVQVKSTISLSKNEKWQVGLGHRPYSLDKTAGKIPYDPDDLDYFAVIDGNGNLYFIPIAAVAGRTNVYLSAYEKYMIGDISSFLRSARR